MENKDKFNLKKIIPIVAIIIVIIISMGFITAHKKEKKQEKTIETFSQVVKKKHNNVLTVELKRREIESKITDWNLILINKEHYIPEDYPFTLQDIEDGNQVDSRIVKPLEQMLSDARKQGLKPYICSSYRTFDTQNTLFNRKWSEYKRLGYEQEEAKQKASYWVTLPRNK